MPDQLLRDRLHLARGYPLYVHLRQRRNQRLLRTLIPLEQLGGEPSLPVLRHAELDLADARDQRARVVARTVAEPALAALALAGAQGLRHLRLERLLQHRAHDRLQEILLRGQKGLDLGQRRPQLLYGHGGLHSS